MLGILLVRAALFLVPLAIVVGGRSLGGALRATVAMWQSAPITCGMTALVLAALFGAYGAVGGTLGTAVLGSEVPPQAIRSLLGFGALVLHLLAGYVVFHQFWPRLGDSAR
jgi:hypothetical protein